MTRRFLIVTWDGAGNLVPTLAVAQHLVNAGYDVRLMGHRSIERRAGGGGWRVRPFVHTLDVDSAADVEQHGGMLRLARDLWCHPSVAIDVGEELARQPADVVIADCMLFAALWGALSAGVPTVSLFNGGLAPFRHGQFVDLLTPLLAPLNASGVAGIHDACALSVVAAPREFEPSIAIPANARFAGPLLDGPPLLRTDEAASLPTTGGPLVLISLSTSDQGQVPVLRRIVDAVSRLPVQAIVTTGPAIDPAAVGGDRAGKTAHHVRIVRFAPHRDLLPAASLVVTHAGLGTVMAALAHGVPMLSLPFGRDQFFNASRVEAIGAGRTIAADADADLIARAIDTLLGDNDARAAARGFSRVIAAYRGGADALSAVERLAHVECGA
jgi:UDP:flavonoid glycosyltransferase YjiC (YdhE family)